MARIAVVGVGAIGGAVAAPLIASGAHEVTLCVREPFATLRLEGPAGRIEVPARCEREPARVAPVDWILLATKAYDVPDAAPWLRALCRAGATLAVLQNGVEHRERVQPYAGEAEILPVVVECPAERTAPGRVTQRAPARLTVPAGEAGSAFAALFAGPTLAVEPTPDFTSAAWRKLCLNVASGPLLALTGRPHEVLHAPGMAELARGLIAECLAVGRAEGALLEDALPDALVARLLAAPGKAGTSMLYDRRAGRRLEGDARNGAVARIGKRHGIATPLNAAVCALLEASVDSAAGGER
ncbi:MAG: 2-dehydropantoate 2-reductase [Myxococcota bacterium]